MTKSEFVLKSAKFFLNNEFAIKIELIFFSSLIPSIVDTLFKLDRS